MRNWRQGQGPPNPPLHILPALSLLPLHRVPALAAALLGGLSSIRRQRQGLEHGLQGAHGVRESRMQEGRRVNGCGAEGGAARWREGRAQTHTRAHAALPRSSCAPTLPHLPAVCTLPAGGTPACHQHHASLRGAHTRSSAHCACLCAPEALHTEPRGKRDACYPSSRHIIASCKTATLAGAAHAGRRGPHLQKKRRTSTRRRWRL